MAGRGEYDRLVRFERATTVETGLGTIEEESWALIERAWAKVLFGTGTERRQAGAEGAAQTATFRVRSTAALRGVSGADRIVFDSRNWGITSISPIGGEAHDIEFTATVTRS